MTANGLSSYELFANMGRKLCIFSIDTGTFCKKSLFHFFTTFDPFLMILCFYFCMTSGYYFFKITTSRILGPRALGPRALGPRALGPRALGPRVLGPRALGPRALGPRAHCPVPMGPLETRGTPRILDILPPPVPTRAWAEIRPSGQPLTGTYTPFKGVPVSGYWFL